MSGTLPTPPPYYSHLSAPMPDTQTADRGKRIFRRLWWVITISILTTLVVGVYVFSIVHRVWHPETFRALYDLHDVTYLWHRGYYFFKYYPYSIIFWGVLLTLSGMLVISWITLFSFVKRPQRWLLSRLLHGAKTRDFL